ncbi:MAG: TIGR00159 family protein, partial [Oscillibacter sp.]
MDLNFAEWLAVVGRYLLTIKVTDFLDIGIMAFVLYKVLDLIKSTKAASLLKGLIVFLLVLWMASFLELNGITYIMSHMVQVGVLALIILFQPEIRRILEQMGSRRFIGFFIRSETGDALEHTISQTVLACSEMSQARTGALI